VPSEDLTSNYRLKSHIESYHCRDMKKMNIKKMCTSIAFGFYLRNEDDFTEFRDKIRAMSMMEDSFISVSDIKPKYLKEFKKEEEKESNDDDFVII
jgi:hypothetical protein